MKTQDSNSSEHGRLPAQPFRAFALIELLVVIAIIAIIAIPAALTRAALSTGGRATSNVLCQ